MYVDERIKNSFRLPQPEGRGKFLRLDQNENPEGVPQWLFDSVIDKITPEFLAIYPEEGKLTEKYAKMLGLEAENVTLCDGSVVGIQYVINVFGEPGKEIIYGNPTFAMYWVFGEAKGMIKHPIGYNPDFTFDYHKILDSINENTGIVVLVNPNMPVGNTYSMNEIREIIEKAKKYDCLVLIDEAYYYFNDQSAVNLVNEYSNVIILRTFSKMLSIPALRLGAIISCKDNVTYIKNYKPHYTINSVALLFGEAIVDNQEKLISENSKKFEEGKRYITEELDRLGYKWLPSKGCYLCLVPKHITSTEAVARMRENGILVSTGSGDLKPYLRVTVWEKKYMKQFMDTLEKVDTE